MNGRGVSLSLLFVLITFFNSTVLAKNDIKIQPGKSLGDVKIGQDISSLQKAGYLINSSYDPNLEFKYFKKHLLHFRSAQEKVVEIWYEGAISDLMYKGRRLPKTKKLSVLKKFFKDCEKNHEGSGGATVLCANRGVLLSYNRNSDSVSLSVVSPQK